MAKILKEKQLNDTLPFQKLYRQCVNRYKKLSKPPENGNMTEIIQKKTSQDKLASDNDFFAVWISKKET